MIECRTGRTTIPPTRKVSVCIQYPHCSESGLSLVSRNEKNRTCQNAAKRTASFLSCLVCLFPSKVKFCRYDLSHVHTTPSRPASAKPVATALKTRSISDIAVQLRRSTTMLPVVNLQPETWRKSRAGQFYSYSPKVETGKKCWSLCINGKDKKKTERERNQAHTHVSFSASPKETFQCPVNVPDLSLKS